MASASTLKVAEIFADLDSLVNTDNAAAHALLTANKTLSTSRSLRRKSTSLPSRPSFDALGKRLVARNLSRADSNISTQSTLVPTPGDASPGEKDEDLKRADELVRLYEMRGKFKKFGDTGLGRAKERVDRVVQQYAKKELEERERVAKVKARHLGVA